jgi:pilus assembly protein CpaB
MAFASVEKGLERPAIMVPIALLLLLVAAALLWAELAHRKAPDRALVRPSAAPLPLVLVASTNVARGQVLTARDYTLQPWERTVPRAALRRTEDAEGHVALHAVGADTPLRADDLSPMAIRGIAARVPEGYRAYALPVSEAAVVGGFVQAGDHVDLYLTLPGALFGDSMSAGRRQDDQSKSTSLLQDVIVLATGTRTETDGRPDTGLRTVTLALKADDLGRVALANRLGAISFAIRNPVDAATQTPATAGLASLLGVATTKGQAKAAPAKTARRIPLLSGRDRILMPVPLNPP